MIRNISPTLIPAGGVYTAKEFFVNEEGPKRRGGTVALFGGATVDYPPVRSVISFRKTDGTLQVMVLDSKFLYVGGASSLTGKYLTVDSGTIACSGTTVTGSGTDFTDDINEGDIIVLDADGSGDGPEEAEIASIGGGTSLTVDAAPTGTYAAGTDYEIRKAFGAADPYRVDWTLARNKLVFTDFARRPLSWDGSQFDYLTGTTNVDFIPRCTLFHADRLFFGGELNSGTDYRQGLTWSITTDITDFTLPTTSTQMRLDLPYNSGYIHRLTSLGPLLVQYHTDAIYVGRPTSFGNSLPFAFDKVETGGIGLVGPRAVYSWIEGNFFVGQDDIYFMNLNGGLERIGSPVVKETIGAVTNYAGVYVTSDPVRERIVFGFPDQGDEITKQWSFSYKANAWSYNELPATFLANEEVVFDTTWESITDTGWNSTLDVSWDEYSSEGSPRKFYFGYTGQVFNQSDSVTVDADSTTIQARIETGDYDFDVPDTRKTFTRMSVKIDRELTSDLTFTVTGSVDEGREWKSLGTLTIEAGEDEGIINFLLTGAAARFRLATQSQVVAYIIEEIVLRVRTRDIETFAE